MSGIKYSPVIIIQNQLFALSNKNLKDRGKYINAITLDDKFTLQKIYNNRLTMQR